MRVAPDLHREDEVHRIDLRAHLRTLRSDAGMTCRDVARKAGLPPDAVLALEARTSWEVPSVQRWARALNHRLTLDVRRIQIPAPDFEAEVLQAAAAVTPADEDARLLAIVCDDLIRARQDRFVVEQFADRIGVDSTVVRDWEKLHARTTLRMVQRYTRGLGGWLKVSLEPVPS